MSYFRKQPGSSDPSYKGTDPVDPFEEVAQMYAAQRETTELDISPEGLIAYFEDGKNCHLPEPGMLRAASEIVGNHFTELTENGDYGDHEIFKNNVDSIVSATTALLESRYEVQPKENELDAQIQALFASALAHAKKAERTPGSRVARPDVDKFRYADIRSYTRASDKNPDAFADLAKVGADCAAILILASNAVATVPTDKVRTGGTDPETGNYTDSMEFTPGNKKDYIHWHVGLVLKNIRDTHATQE